MAEKRTRKSPASAVTGSGKTGAKKGNGEAGQASRKSRASAPAPSAKAKGSSPTGAGGDRDQRVRDRAYEIWEQEGRPSGRERDHWERADREIGR